MVIKEVQADALGIYGLLNDSSAGLTASAKRYRIC